MKTTIPANLEPLTLTEIEKKHIRTLRALSERRFRAALKFTLCLQQMEPEEIESETAAPRLRLVVDNSMPCVE